MILSQELQKNRNKTKAGFLKSYFKTGKGEYGEGDIFLGITVPQQRAIAKKHQSIPLSELKKYIASKIHEYRFTALEILVFKYEKATTFAERKKIVDFYLQHTKHINNWDLVDTSIGYILGAHCAETDTKILYKLVKSKNIWERRMAIIATGYFIKNKNYKDTLKISELLLKDTHDLIHKAVGWMLREVGNRSLETEEAFLKKHYQKMPRTMLRYAIEKFSPEKRAFYLKKT